MKNLIFLTLLAATWSLIGCDYTEIKNLPQQQMESSQPCNINPEVNLEQLVSYEIVRAEVFKPHCLNCHSGSSSRAGVDLSNYFLARTQVDAIEFNVVTTNRMPPRGGPLGQDQVDLVAQWINDGALNEAAIENCLSKPSSNHTSHNF